MARALMRGCSSLVIRCFRRVEHFADWLTGAAGPYFVFLCWTLILTGGISFFDAVARDFTWIETLLLAPLLVLVPFNLYGQYFLVTHVPPGFPSPRALARADAPMSTDAERKWHSPKGTIWTPESWGFRCKGERSVKPLTGDDDNSRAVHASQDGKRVRRCRKCDGPKPERTHHCSVCKRCVLLMDHHCPWINSCVGLYNQRHFVLFMSWLSVGCWCVCYLGMSKFWDSIGVGMPWKALLPDIVFTLTWVLCAAIGIAVPVLCAWHLFMVAQGETSIEQHDNAYLETKAKADGLVYLNPYDMGYRRNLQLFFNLGPTGYSIVTLLLPLCVPPTSNGWTYPKRPIPITAELPSNIAEGLHAPELSQGLFTSEAGLARGKYVYGDDGSLTDDEDGGGGWMGP